MPADFLIIAEEKGRFFRIGPPMENHPGHACSPVWGWGAGLKKSRAFTCGRCRKYQPLPWKAFVPLFITMFTTVPPLLPNSRPRKLLFWTFTSLHALDHGS